MTAGIEAVYENGILRPVAPIALPEGARVEIIVVSKELAPSDREPADILAEIAALPVEGSAEPFSGRDHDAALHGKPAAR